MDSRSATAGFRLRDWTVIPLQDCVQRGSEVRHVQPKTMDLLVFLARQPRRVLSKNEIIDGVWEGRAVSDSALTRLVADARRALGDPAHEPQFIETIPKRGYRLVARAQRLDERGPGACTAGLPSAAERIVVLPFQSLGSPDRHDFVLGVTDEITTRLAAASGLAVISRQSAQQYAGSSKNAGEIGRELAVQYILEGSVRWGSSDRAPWRVRISPQLIRTVDDSHVWAESFDGMLEDVIEMQIEIAEKVLAQLDVALAPGERSQLLEPRTSNPEAYEAYLTGLAHLRRPDFWSTENMRIIALSWERAVRLDPSFAVAQGALAAILASSHAIGLDQSPQRLASAKAALDCALELDPDLPMAHFARGQCHAARREHDLAIEALEAAALGLPNESEIHRSLGLILRSRGQWEQSMERSRRALELDPRDARLSTSLGFTYMVTRHYAEADRLYQRARTLQPDQSSAYVLGALNDWLGFGDLARARARLEAMPAADHPSALAVWWQQEIQERDYEAALARLDGSPLELLEDYLHLTPKSHLRAITLELLGRDGDAPAELRSALRLLERRLEAQPRDARALTALAEVLAGLGHRKPALNAARTAVEVTSVEEDAVAGPICLEALARVELLTGDRQGALTRLAHLVSIPSTVSPRLLELDPRWDPIREDPRFGEILTRHCTR